MAETLHLPNSVQGNGTAGSIGTHFYRVCVPAGCIAVMGLSNAFYMSRNVPKVEHNHCSRRLQKNFAQTMERTINLKQHPVTRSNAPDLDAVARQYSSNPDEGDTTLVTQLTCSQTDAAYVSLDSYIRIPHHPARPFGGLFCGNTPDLTSHNALQGGQKKEGSLAPPLFEAVPPCSEPGVTPSLCV